MCTLNTHVCLCAGLQQIAIVYDAYYRHRISESYLAIYYKYSLSIETSSLALSVKCNLIVSYILSQLTKLQIFFSTVPRIGLVG